MRLNRLKVQGSDAVYHCMTRTVDGERFFGDGEKEVLRKIIWQVADFSGVDVLTYCVMSNHFHVLVEVPELGNLSDAELMRRYKVLYPKPTKYQEASIKLLEADLAAGGEEAEYVRGFVDAVQSGRRRKHPPRVNSLKGDVWGDVAVTQSLRRQVFS
jgi:REP element-mobilizing transposase RayT